MLQKIEQLKTAALDALKDVETTSQAEAWLSEYAGRKSNISQILRQVKDLSPEEKSAVGKSANQARVDLEKAGNKALQKLNQIEMAAKLKHEFLDITLPGVPVQPARLHPLTQERIRVEEVFSRMGFEVWDPNLVDDDYHNFNSLNIPAGHPARDMWDTLRINDDLSLIVHTSSMQNRIIQSSQPPIRAIVPGKTFRHEATDARHEHSFFQVEGVYVDRGIKLSDMIGTLKQFLTYYFEREMEIKIQPTFFPFVEPGLEIMMECPVCNGAKPASCGGCGGSGWMEVIPCGPIHPYVLREAGVDANVYSGFAWGFGLDRLVMIKRGVNDVRHFHSGKLDFLNQF